MFGAVALVVRGGCNFTEKVLRAQTAGAIGVVVTDSVPSENWAILMSGGSDDETKAITIPSVFVSQQSGRELWRIVGGRMGVFVTLNSTGQIMLGGRADALEQLIVYLVVSLVLLAISGFCGLFLALGIQRCQRHYRTRALKALRTYRFRSDSAAAATAGAAAAAETAVGGTAGAAGAAGARAEGAVGPGGAAGVRVAARGAREYGDSGSPIAAAATAVAAAEGQGEAGGAVGDTLVTCAVCLDDYEEGDVLKVMPCGHAFHAACIDPWLRDKSGRCPMCKAEALSGRQRSAAAATNGGGGLEAIATDLILMTQENWRLWTWTAAVMTTAAVLRFAALEGR
ncbi:unnamed protein product [Phaeothamnion confervicola]